MGAFEYLLLFAAVIMGLAVSDLAVSLHHLLNAGKRVRWDILPVLAAALAFERIVIQWWSWHAADHIATDFTFGMFLGILISATLLFLMSAVALPDYVEGHIDLRAHYERISKRFWLLFAAQWLLFNAVSTWAQHTISGAHLSLASPAWLILPISLTLAFWRNRVVQGLCLAGFLLFYTAVFLGQRLG